MTFSHCVMMLKLGSLGDWWDPIWNLISILLLLGPGQLLCHTYEGRFLLWPKLLCLRFFFVSMLEGLLCWAPFSPILCALWGESKSLECLFQQSGENVPVWHLASCLIAKLTIVFLGLSATIHFIHITRREESITVMTTSSWPTLHQREMKAFVAMQFLKSFICAS